jgi:beta-xylosidase
MKTLRLVIVTFFLSLFILACQSSVSTAQSEPIKSDTQVATTMATQPLKATDTEQPPTLPAPTDTSIPSPTPTVEPSLTPSPTPAIIFRDDFNNVLAQNWKWVRENKQRWSLSANSGFLRLTLNPGNCNGLPRNFPIQPLPAGNYKISTYLEFTPISNFQFAGLIIYQDDNNNIKLGRAFCNASNCAGNGVYFDNVITGVFKGTNYTTSTTNPSRLYLRLQREGNNYTGFFSEDGQNWIKIGQHTSEIKPVGVGLYAGQSCEGSVPADFDYFVITQLP